MNHTLVEIFSYSVGIGAVIGAFRLRHIDRVYDPFILLLWMGLASEVISTILIHRHQPNALPTNIYVFAEAILITFFLKKLGLFDKRPKMFYLIWGLFAAAWIAENFVFSTIHVFGSYFRILYSFIIVLMSIHQINKLIHATKKTLLRDPNFLILTGFIIFFTYKVLIEIFYVYGFDGKDSFSMQVYRLMTYINLLVNLIYAIALLWIPQKRASTLLY